jgi:hypothetical protein
MPLLKDPSDLEEMVNETTADPRYNENVYLYKKKSLHARLRLPSRSIFTPQLMRTTDLKLLGSLDSKISSTF